MRTAPSLRANFSWTFFGNVIYGASQWAILSLLAKLGGAGMLGEYTFAVALAAPVSMLSHLNLRAVLATDVTHRHSFGDYLALRLWTSLAALIVIGTIGAASGRFAVTVLLGTALAAENISDIYHGAWQRNERMDAVARALTLRSIASVTALGLALLLHARLVIAVAALAAVRSAIVLFYDHPRGSRGEKLARTGPAALWDIFRTALPLGIVLMLISLTTNLPRYSIERYLGSAQLGVFAAIASLVTAAQLVVNAMGQSATPRLARLFSAGELTKFKHLSGRMVLAAAGMGIAGVAGAALLGRPVLALAYRREFAAYNSILIAMMCSGCLFYVSGVLGYVNTSTRAFRPQMPLYATTAAVCGLSSVWLVPRIGLAGAVLSLALAAAAQIAGQLLILRHAVRAVEPRP